MIYLLKYRKLVVSAALIFGALGAVYWEGGERVQAKWDKAKAEQVAAQFAKNLADQAKLIKLEETKNENLDYVSNLYFGLGKSQRLRLPQSPCTGSQTSSDNPTGEGIIPAGVSGSAEQAVNDFDLAYRNSALRSDQIVEDCRVLNEFARGTNPIPWHTEHTAPLTSP